MGLDAAEVGFHQTFGRDAGMLGAGAGMFQQGGTVIGQFFIIYAHRAASFRAVICFYYNFAASKMQ